MTMTKIGDPVSVDPAKRKRNVKNYDLAKRERRRN